MVQRQPVTDKARQTVWVFNGPRPALPAAVFNTKDEATEWVASYRLTGMLTAYPVGVSVYDWVIREGKWKPEGPQHRTPAYVARFSSAYLEHYHFEDGVQVS